MAYFTLVIKTKTKMRTVSGVSVKAGLWTGPWTGLWTGLDCGLDWTDQNSCIQTANVTKAMKGRLQPVSSCFLACCNIISSISERSKVTCIFNELQQWAQTTVMDNMGIFLLVLHFTKGWSLVITALLILQAGRAS